MSAFRRLFVAGVPILPLYQSQLIRRDDDSAASFIDSEGTVTNVEEVAAHTQPAAKYLPPHGNTQDMWGKWTPIDGGFGKACRGEDANDDQNGYKMTIYGDTVTSIEMCKRYCTQTPNCMGVEHNPYVKRCEIWTRPEGIGATADDEGTTCLSFVPGFWKAADGGANRACRGSRNDDDKDEYYFRFEGKSVKSLDGCKRKCVNTYGCKGIEHSPDVTDGHCEVWVRPEGIGATQAQDGHMCLSYQPEEDDNMWPGRWDPVEGGVNRACRGKTPNDDENSYYHKIVGAVVASLNVCKKICANSAGCKGIEHNPRGQCEIWFRGAGIESTRYNPGYSCLSYLPGKWREVDGGANRACRGKDIDDNRMEYKLMKFGDSMRLLEHCKEVCLSVGSCKGIEHDPAGFCSVWTEPISASVESKGTSCIKFVAIAPPKGGIETDSTDKNFMVPGGFSKMSVAPAPGPPGVRSEAMEHQEQVKEQVKAKIGGNGVKAKPKPKPKKKKVKPSPAPEEDGAQRQTCGVSAAALALFVGARALRLA